MNSPRIVSLFLNLPRFQFDRAPDVSAIIGKDNSGCPILVRCASSVPLTATEHLVALDRLFSAYQRAESRSLSLGWGLDFAAQLESDRARHRSDPIFD